MIKPNCKVVRTKAGTAALPPAVAGVPMADFVLWLGSDGACAIYGADEHGAVSDISEFCKATVTSDQPHTLPVKSSGDMTFGIGPAAAITDPASPARIRALVEWKDKSLGPYTIHLSVNCAQTNDESKITIAPGAVNVT